MNLSTPQGDLARVTLSPAEAPVLRSELDDRIRVIVTAIAEHPEHTRPMVEALRGVSRIQDQLPLKPREPFDVCGPPTLIFEVLHDAAREASYRAYEEMDCEPFDLVALRAALTAVEAAARTLLDFLTVREVRR